MFGSLARQPQRNLLQSGGTQAPENTEKRAMLNAISDRSGPAFWPQRPSRRPPIAEVARYVEANFSERVTLKDLALVAELSVFRLVTVFRREMGISPYRYLSAVRVRKAQELMRNGVPPAIAATEVGFFDQSHLCRHFRAICGMTPGQFLAKPDSAWTAT
jgi:transcriptional regulator GlxA family with amidase domain